MRDTLTPHELIEIRRAGVQAVLDSAKSLGERNRLGQFATPALLALEIARYVRGLTDREATEIRFADPAVGTGSFYSAALSVFGRDFIASAVGIELDPDFCDAARSLWTEQGLEVISGDFARILAGGNLPPAPNLILANPPYIRHHHLDSAAKKRLQALARQLTGLNVSGLAGLYVYFVLVATHWLQTDGYAAWLIPSEFMDVNYGASPRHYLSEAVTLIRVHRYDPSDAQFGDALVSSAVLVLRKSPPPSGHAVEFTLGGTLTQPRATERVPNDELLRSRKWTEFPRHADNDRRRTRDGGFTLGDFFDIRRGIATGCNDFFIIARDDAMRRGIAPRHLKPILPSPRRLDATIVEADAEGYPLLQPQLCVVDCDLPESTLPDHDTGLWMYLQTAVDLGIKTGYLVSKRRPWYKQEQRRPAPYLCTYMGRGSGQRPPFRFVWNRSQAIATNLYLMLYPRGLLATMLRDHPERAAGIFAILQGVSGHELRGEGRVYGGGLNKIEPLELGRVSATAVADRWPELTALPKRQPGLFS